MAVQTLRPRARVWRLIQRGTITVPNASASATATITSVDTAKSRMGFLGFSSPNVDSNSNSAYARVALTNSTTVTATRNGTNSDTIVGFEVVTGY